MGLAALMGALIPLFEIEDIQSNLAFPYVIGGMVVMLQGVAVVASAGIWRDKVLAAEGKEIAGIRRGKAFWIGLAIAITSGVLSALLNVGFVHAQPVAKSVVQVYQYRMPGNTGADGMATIETITRNSSLAAWVVVLAGAFIMNAGYALFLLWKNNSWDPAETKGTFRSMMWAILAGLFWFAALGIYGQGAALMDAVGPVPLGAVIGWPMLLGLALIISNVWAFSAGEWKGAAGPFKTMLAGVAVLILACCVLGYANHLQVL
jgi:L-rhamnose-H+ transport protein